MASLIVERMIYLDMKKSKLLLGTLLFIIGFIGILSILTMDLKLPEEIRVILEAKFTPSQIKLLTLVNPMIYLVIAVVVGTLLFDKVGLSIPLLEKWVGRNPIISFNLSSVQYGVLGGIISGILLFGIAFFAKSFLVAEFEVLNEGVQPTFLSRVFYGGFTEEILLRFGIMTLIVWLSSKLTKNLTALNYWVGILLAAILFAIGHFPVVFSTIPEPSFGILSYVLIANTVGGIIFGWLYWKKGLESACIAHIVTHLVLLVTEGIVG